MRWYGISMVSKLEKHGVNGDFLGHLKLLIKCLTYQNARKLLHLSALTVPVTDKKTMF